MHRRAPRLFTQLRRHRGVWVLALAVLLFKVAMSTFCILDGPAVVFAAEGGNTAVLTAAAESDDDLCVLSEGNGCHCTCAHAIALPATDAVMAIANPLSRVHATLHEVASPAFVRSPLRPPIA